MRESISEYYSTPFSDLEFNRAKRLISTTHEKSLGTWHPDRLVMEDTTENINSSTTLGILAEPFKKHQKVSKYATSFDIRNTCKNIYSVSRLTCKLIILSCDYIEIYSETKISIASDDDISFSWLPF